MSKFRFLNDQRRLGSDEWLDVGFLTGGESVINTDYLSNGTCYLNIPGRISSCTAFVMCLSEAVGSSKVIDTHKEAHRLIPAQVLKVQQGQ